MISTARVMLKVEKMFDPKFIAGTLGNIKNEGVMGQFEETGGDGIKYCYQQCVNDCYEYNKYYSGKTITNIGISEARTFSDKVKKSENEKNEKCTVKKRCILSEKDGTYLNAGDKCEAKFGIGIIQWTSYEKGNGIRKDGLLKAYEDFKENNNNNNFPSKDECIKIESKYLVDEMESKTYKIYDYWLENGPHTPYDAGYIICTDFIGNTKSEAKKRGNYAEVIYAAMYNYID